MKALESLLVEKGLVDPAALDELIDTFETRSGRATAPVSSPAPGSTRPIKQRLREDAAAAIAELGFIGARRGHRGDREHAQGPQPGRVHALFVLPVVRARAAAGLVQVRRLPFARGHRSARGAEGVGRGEVPDDVEVRVWDSTAELRYLVLPERPAGTEGWSEEQLAEIVTRDAMIGVAQVTVPAGSRR